MSFRALLLALVLGLILVSTVTMGTFAVLGTSEAVRELIEGQIETTLDAVTGRVEALFAPSERILQTLDIRLREGSVEITDPEALARHFAEILQFETGIAWISFGFADGRFAGTWTEDGRLVINLSQPGGGPPREWTLGADGDLTPFQRGTLPAAFDARQRPWFQLAEKETGMVWTPPYDFASGGRGITVAKAVRAIDGALLGVLTVDFRLSDIVAYLDELAREFAGDTLVFSINGNVLATPRDVEAKAAVDEIQKLLGDPAERDRLEFHQDRLVTTVSSGGDDFMVGMRAARIAGGLQCISSVIFSRKVTFGSIESILQRSGFTALIALALSLVAGFILAGRVASPLKIIAHQMGRIGQFDLTPEETPVSAIREVRVLSDAVVRLRTSLKSFAHYVPVDLVRDLVRSGGVAALGGERREVSLIFCDLAGFTSYAEQVAPEMAVETLTEYFEDFGEAVDSHGGVIDKFLGDGIMALFNAPERIPTHAAAACRASLAGVAALRNRTMPGTGGPFRVRVGLHCGEALIGNVGTSTRFTYTAIGDCVNLCSRIEGLNKFYGTSIIASSVLREAAGDAEFLWRRLDRVAVVGRSEPLEIYELVALRSEAAVDLRRVVESYETAFFAYQRRDFVTAAALLESAASSDEVSRILLDRIKAGPPAPDWEGVFEPREK